MGLGYPLIFVNVLETCFVQESLETDATVDRIDQLKLKQQKKSQDGRGNGGRGGRGGRGRGRGAAAVDADGEAAEAEYSLEQWMAWYERPGDYWYETPKKKASKREPTTEPESIMKEKKSTKKSTKNPKEAEEPKSDMEPKSNKKRKEPTSDGDVEPKSNKKRKEPTNDGDVEPKTNKKHKEPMIDGDVEPKTTKAPGKPKAKAKAKGKASKNAKSVDEKPVAKRKRLPDCAGFTNKRAQAANGEPTFARRYRPATPFKAKRWEAIRNCFRSQVRPQISGAPSLYEDIGFMQVYFPSSFLQGLFSNYVAYNWYIY